MNVQVITRDGEAEYAVLPWARGLSLEQVAREVGISPSYMAMIERGEREASEAILFALERVLGKATGA